MRRVALVLLCVLFAGQAGAQCGELCADGQVTIDELVAAVGMALAGESGPGDCDGNGRISIDELVVAVRSALDECGRAPLPTRTPTATGTATPTRTQSREEMQLSQLIGAWAVTHTTTQPVTNYYLLDRIELVDGEPFLVGLNLDTLRDVVAGFGGEGQRTFAMLARAPFACDYYRFDLGRNDQMVGEHYTVRLVNGGCEDFIDAPHPMVGSRTSHVPLAGRRGDGLAAEAGEGLRRLARRMKR